jgi:uncharacterized protein (DUF983 family)
MSGSGTDGQLRRITTLFMRALRLRCPSCGGHPVILRWFMVSDNCPACGIRLQRGEEGYWVGAYMFNLIAAELVWAGSMVAVVWWTWPSPPWTGLLVGGVLLMVLMPVAFFPFSRLVFLAFDLVFRPPQPEDYPER